MRIISKLTFLLVGTVLFCQGCDNAPPPSAPTPKKPPVSNKATATNINYAWPPATADSRDIVMEADLTTKNYYVVFDSSGSMSERKCSLDRTKIEVGKDALAKFADLVPADANLGLLVFEKSFIQELVPLGKGNRKEFVSAVRRPQPAGETPLQNALQTGYQKLEEQGRKQLGYGDYYLVVVTDGEASQGQDPTPTVKWILANTPIQIHTIGFCIGPDHSLNMKGRTVYKAADNPDQLQQGLADVLAEAEVFDVSDFNF